MQLTDETFKSLVQSIQVPTPGEASKTERRKFPRVPFKGYATIIRCGKAVDRQPAYVVVRDVSVGSIGIESEVPIRYGERFLLCLPTAAGSVRSIMCSVIRWQPITQRTFIIGALFVQELAAGLAGALSGADIAELKKLQDKLDVA